jgi:hypothetical protein
MTAKVAQDGLQRLEIGMDVGDERVAQLIAPKRPVATTRGAARL